jgi:DNA-entry nuclease
MKKFLVLLLISILMTTGCYYEVEGQPQHGASVANVPAFSGKEAYVVIGDNQPEFTDGNMTTVSYEYYSPLDRLGRCGYAMACIGTDLMPTEERGSIGQVKPSGWQTVKYDFIDGKYLYNRCHLIGFQLSGENANEQNLITGTRYLNVEGMLPFENMIADYVKETGNHVLYRVTPIYDGDNLVARGVQMEGLSVEDGGDGICFHVYAYNNQPGITIDYLDGSSCAVNDETGESQIAYVINISSGKFHLSTCGQVAGILPNNRKEFTGDRKELLAQNYQPAGCCKP